MSLPFSSNNRDWTHTFNTAVVLNTNTVCPPMAAPPSRIPIPRHGYATANLHAYEIGRGFLPGWRKYSRKAGSACVPSFTMSSS